MKKCVEMCLSVFEMWKLLFELGDQTALNFMHDLKNDFDLLTFMDKK